jgi:hypothetical protein
VAEKRLNSGDDDFNFDELKNDAIISFSLESLYIFLKPNKNLKKKRRTKKTGGHFSRFEKRERVQTTNQNQHQLSNKIEIGSHLHIEHIFT